MPSRDHDPDMYRRMVEERELLTSELPEAFRSILASIRREQEAISEVVLDRIYAMGRIIEDARQGHGTRARYLRCDIVTRLAQTTGTDVRTLKYYARLARIVPRGKLYMLLQSPITWHHVAVILESGEDDRWESWAAKVVAEKLTAEELRAAVLGERLARPKPAPRRPRPPRNVKQALPRLDKLLGHFLSTANVLFGTDFDISSSVIETPPDCMTEDLRRQLADIADRLDMATALASENAQRLRAAIALVDQVLMRRATNQPQDISED